MGWSKLPPNCSRPKLTRRLQTAWQADQKLELNKPRRSPSQANAQISMRKLGADDAIRTRDPHLGKVMLYP
jgi:hypothetical protein